jgi:hypothetical protein
LKQTLNGRTRIHGGSHNNRQIASLRREASREVSRQQLIAVGGYRLDAARAARVVRVTTPYAREEALKTVYVSASCLFPKHFNADGLSKR